MVERIKQRWHDLVPAWVPICISLLAIAYAVGQYTQRVDDRLTNLETDVHHITEYIVHKDGIPPISQRQVPLAKLPGTVAER